MTLLEYRNRGSWRDYERTLTARGWVPCWTAAVERRVAQASAPCPDCGQAPAYVGMRKGQAVLSFAVCRCDRWASLSPVPSGALDRALCSAPGPSGPGRRCPWQKPNRPGAAR